MTNRQKALAAYIRTLGPHVSRARTVNEFIERLMGCIREDGIFLASQFATGLITQGKERIDAGAPDAVKAVTGIVSQVATSFLRDLTRPRKS